MPPIRAGRRDPIHVIAHRLEQRAHKALEVIRRHGCQVGADLGPRGVLRLLQRAGALDGLARFLDLLLRLALLLPCSVAPDGFPLEDPRLWERPICLPASVCQRPAAAALDQPSSLHRRNRGEADGLLVTSHRRVAGIGFSLELAWRHRLLDRLEHLRRRQPVRVVHQHLEHAAHKFAATPAGDLSHLSAPFSSADHRTGHAARHDGHRPMRSLHSGYGRY